MKKVALTAAGLSAALLLSGCVLVRSADDSHNYQVYYRSAEDADGAAVAAETYAVPDGQAVVPALLDLLLQQPYVSSQSSPFPEGTELRSWSLQNGVLSLDFSEPYGGLSGIDLTLANYCLTLTLCQVEDVDAVQVTVEGETLPFQTTTQLRPEDVILSGSEEQPIYYTAALWFPRTSGEGLGLEYRQMMLVEGDSLISGVFGALLAGPLSESLGQALPPDTYLISGVAENGICYLDLSQEFMALFSGTDAQIKLCLYSLVNTMSSNLDGVSAVQIRVEGQNLGMQAGINLSEPLEADASLKKS